LTPVSVLRMAHSFGGVSGSLFLVGCEPATLETEEGRIGLSYVVEAAVPQAIAMIEEAISNFLYANENTTAGLVPA
jgi:hydrogenase maturation protease